LQEQDCEDEQALKRVGAQERKVEMKRDCLCALAHHRPPRLEPMSERYKVALRADWLANHSDTAPARGSGEQER
jgi:hypothetical protein